MNVNTNSNLAMMSSMTGISQQIGQTKTVNGNLSPDKQVNETDRQESSRDIKKEQTPSHHQDIKSQNALRNQAQSVQRRYLSDEQSPEEVTKNTSNEAAENTSPEQKQTRYLDTSRQIQYSFGSFRKETPEEQSPVPRSPLMKAETEKKHLVENLRKWVDLELKQYVRQNQPSYPRKDLREILNTLGSKSEQDNQRIKADLDSKESIDKPTKYNIGNISKITRTMRCFEDIPSENLFEDVM